MATVSLTSTLQYTPPGGTQVTVPFPISATYTPLNVGTIDIPTGTAAAATYDIPFGSVGVPAGASARVLLIHNRDNNQDIGLRINSLPVAPAMLMQLPAGGFFMIAMPVDPAANDLVAAQIEVVSLTTADAEIDYFVFGD